MTVLSWEGVGVEVWREAGDGQRCDAAHVMRAEKHALWGVAGGTSKTDGMCDCESGG